MTRELSRLTAAALAWRKHELARQPFTKPGEARKVASRIAWQRRNLDLIGDLWRAIDDEIASPADSCEGWSNRESWAVALWIDSDRERSSEMLTLVREKMEHDASGLPLRGSDRTSYVASFIREHAADRLTDEDDSLERILCDAAWRRVNWRELAEHYIAKAKDGAS